MSSGMTRPENPYAKGSLIWSIMEGGLQGEFDGLPGWEDLTVPQIGEVLDCTANTVYVYIRQIRLETGYVVSHVTLPGGRRGRAHGQ